MTSVYFSYGWSEGPWQSRRMRHALSSAGFKVTTNISEADIIIAHSLGCYLISPNDAKLIVLIGLPYWPGKPILISLAQNIAANLRNSSLRRDGRWWLSKLIHNVWYIITKPQDTYKAWVARQLERLPTATKNRQILLVRNRSDSFSQADAARQLAKTRGYEYLLMPTEHHEDCWLHPETYVELIRERYG